MGDGVSRRQFVTTTGAVVALGGAGCSELPGDTGQNTGTNRSIGERDDSQPDEWPTLGQNTQNTKFNPGGAGPEDEPSIDWTYDSENIFTPPAVAGGHIGLSGVEHLTVLELDGTQRWSVEYSGFIDEIRSYTFPVVVTNDLVCSSIRRDVSDHVSVVGYTHAGELRWEVELGTPASAGTPSVTYASGVVYVALPTTYSRFDGAGVLAIDAESGELRWSTRLDPLVPVTPVTAGQFVLLPTSDEQLVALSTETGDVEWRFELLAPQIPRPVVSDDTVYVEYGNDTVGLAVEDGSISREATDRFGGRFAFVDQVVIEPAGDTLRAYDVQRAELLWEREYAAALNPPAVADGVAYVGGEDKRIRGIEIASGDELWSRQLDDDVMRPIVTQGRVLAVSGDTVYSLS